MTEYRVKLPAAVTSPDQNRNVAKCDVAKRDVTGARSLIPSSLPYLSIHVSVLSYVPELTVRGFSSGLKEEALKLGIKTSTSPANTNWKYDIQMI